MTTDKIPQTVPFRISSTSPSLPRSTASTRVPRRGSAQGGRAAVRVGGGLRPLSGRPAGAREGPAHAGGAARPADLRHCLRPSRWRRRPPCRRPDPQAVARARPGCGRGAGLAADENGVGRSALYELARELCGSSSGISAGWTGGRGGSRSTWTRPTTRRTAPSSSPSSTGTTIAGATCRCWRF